MLCNSSTQIAAKYKQHMPGICPAEMDQMVVLQAGDVPIVVGRIRFSITSRDLLTLVTVVGCCSCKLREIFKTSLHLL